MMTQAYTDIKGQTNCATCVKYERDTGRCSDEQGVNQRYEDTPNFAEFKLMMQGNKPVFI